MRKWSEKDMQHFYAAQKEVMNLFRPYHARCLDQHKSENGIVESFVLYNPEADVPDDRHSLRGCVMVWYGRPMGERCPVNIFYEEHMAATALELEYKSTWEMSKNILARLLPPTPKSIT